MGETALIKAARFGHKDIVETLLQNNADVNAKSKNGTTALIIAIQGNHKETVEILLQNNANVNEKSTNGRTALIWAASDIYIDLEIVKLLLDNAADIDLKDNEGKTALDWAREINNNEITNLLIPIFWQYFVYISQSIYDGMNTIIPARFLKIY